MEITESEDTKLSKPNLDDSPDNLAKAINSSEIFLDELLSNMEKEITLASTDTEAENDQSHCDAGKSNTKESAEMDKSKSFFHLSDNMKKDLSMLAFPSKSLSRKKGVMSSRVVPSPRITIAEALEKAEDARKNIFVHTMSDSPENKEENICKLSDYIDSCTEIVDEKDKKIVRLQPHSETPETSRTNLKQLDSTESNHSATGSSPTNDVPLNKSPMFFEGKTKSPGTSRVQMTRRMWELLKFTFIHEHFPSSVHMARLAKMMGIPWSQVRNWFTDRRVDNKKAGIYPRDRPLTECSYCTVTLQTEAEQKSHLFSINHVKRILGQEYCGGSSESIKWKKLPKTVNAVSKVSGARVLAVGFSSEDLKKGNKKQEKKKMETGVKNAPHSKELKKLWTEAMLPAQEKEKLAPEWKSIKLDVEENLDIHVEHSLQGKNEEIYDSKIQEKSEHNNYEKTLGEKVAFTSKVVSIPVSADNINPCSVNDNFSVKVNSSSAANIKVAVKPHGSQTMNTSVPSFFSEDSQSKKNHLLENISMITELESRKGAIFIKPRAGGILESSNEYHKYNALPRESSHELCKGNAKETEGNKFMSSPSGKLLNRNIVNNSSKFASFSDYMKDDETKQEHEYDGNSTKIINEVAVMNANNQAYTITQNSALCASSSLKGSQPQKPVSVTYDASVESESGLVVNKITRTGVDKKKVNHRTQPLGTVLRANKTTSPYEGNIIVGYQCPSCNKVYQTEWLMMKHSVTHFKYHCDICYKVYPTENMMKIHLLDHLSGAYEDEKYYSQFSCKVCHSLKCGCYEPLYCKPQKPRIFLRRQKAKRSKKGFISKLNSGPNDHLKISLLSYRKLLVSESLGTNTKVKGEKSSLKSVFKDDTQKNLVVKEDQKEINVEHPIPNHTLRETQIPIAQEKTQAHFHNEGINQEFVSVQGETSRSFLTKGRSLDNIASVSGEQLQIKPNFSTDRKKIYAEQEKKFNWKEIKKQLTLDRKSDTFSPPESLHLNKLGKRQTAPVAKRGGGRRRTGKLTKDFIYDHTDFYYICEICDATFSSKSELSEHMFLHRFKSRIRRGEKRGISSVIEENEISKKVKINEAQDKPDKSVEKQENQTCEMCQMSFLTVVDYRSHMLASHKESKSQNIEVFRCNYCDKIYRRRRELKRHLKRDCVYAPSSLKGKFSTLSCSTNAIEETHYTTVKIDFDEKADITKHDRRGKGRGPIICKYCKAVTKREAEMKRHIWKYCLKIPSEVVKKFMDGASLEDLGFNYVNETHTPTNIDQNTSMNVSETQKPVESSMDEMQIMKNSKISRESTPENHVKTSLDFEYLDSPDICTNSLETSSRCNTPIIKEPINPQNIDTHTIEMLPDGKTAVQECTLPKLVSPVNVRTPIPSSEKISTVQECMPQETSPSLKMEALKVQSVPSEEQSTSNTEESKKISDSTGNLSPTQSPLEIKESSCPEDDVPQSASSTSPLANPVMAFPNVIPAMTASTKSKRPLVCGYCGIWYFREMAILKHMKERCIKIPPFEKDILRKNNILCNVSQKAGGISSISENGAVYKMVKMPEHHQVIPVPVPKDTSNEAEKELNVKVKICSESTEANAKPVEEQDNKSQDVSPPANQVCNTPSKRGSRCRRCHEHFSSQQAVLAHSSVHHGPKKGFYKCKLCHARLAKYKQLREHVWEHTNENPYRCHLCQVKYRSSDRLVDHLFTKHQFTSINEKNLFKWLPGRHGKYRDIKTKDNDGEKLDDVDTNLDSLAEVMVITDNDICSNAASNSKNENKTRKSYTRIKKHLGNENIKEKSEESQLYSNYNENLSESSCNSKETKTTPLETDCTVNNYKINEAHKVVVEDKTQVVRQILDKTFCHKPNSKTRNAKLQLNENEEETSTKSYNSSKKEYGHKEQNTVSSKGTTIDKDEDGFSEEGLLSSVDNLDSIVETVHLTDGHLS